MTEYFVFRDGRVINAITTSKSREDAAAIFRGGVILKTEDECTQAELEAYEFWATRP